MNVRRFTARSSREALGLVRQAFGADAVVLSTRPCEGGIEVLAMAPEGMQEIEELAASAPAAAAPPLPAAVAAPVSAPMSKASPAPAPARAKPATPSRIEPPLDHVSSVERDVARDVEQLAMSTLSFQDYVRERMLKRRQVTAGATEAAEPAPALPPPVPLATMTPPVHEPVRLVARREAAVPAPTPPLRREPPILREPLPGRAQDTWREPFTETAAAEPPRSRPIELPRPLPTAPRLAEAAPGRQDQTEMLSELRSMRGLIEQRFGALAFMEKLQRQPRHANLTQRLLDHGFSPALARKLVESLPDEVEPIAWAAGVLERNLATGEHEPAIDDVGGIYALIGATGVGKTTTTAKLAAAFAARHGAAHLGLVTLDAYRVGAHEQLRAYGRILGVPVHTAHDRASLEDLLELLAGKKMVLIDTAGIAQRDSRTRELLEMLSHHEINRLLVVNASAQGETIEDVLLAYRADSCRGIVLSKLDEAVKLGPALDSMIRHKLRVLAVGNGQRVPEDWHRLSASALVQHALRGHGGPAWRMDAGDVSLIFAGMPSPGPAAPLHA